MINISDRYEEGRVSQADGRRKPVEVRMTQIAYMQGQLDAALSQVTALEQIVSCQRDFIARQ